MATATANHLPDLAVQIIRPALVEARLITEKQARDSVYVVTLAEELRNIEAKIATMEEASGLSSSLSTDHYTACHASEKPRDATWIRTKSRELNQRLRRVAEKMRSPDPL